jgi:hypothetical protein
MTPIAEQEEPQVVMVPKPVVVTTGPTPPIVTSLEPTEPMSEHDSFIAQVDTPGGHILVCLTVIVIAVGMFFLKIPEYKDMVVGALAVLFAAMRGKGGAQ